MPLSAPTTIARYQVLKRLDEGGMGTVYLARDPAIDRLVAIKLLREGFDDPELRERFVREARSAGRLKQANIVTIFDVGDHEEQPFITMEYLQGETLHALIERRAALSLLRKLQLMDELCAGLQYAHRNGVIHRDIKPKNLIMDEEGVLKILDFGIARIGGSGMTQLGAMMGTVNYMAPEQMAGRPIDARADQFSAGAVFYELLSYRRAFPGDFKAVVQTILNDLRFEPLDRIEPALDRQLVDVVHKCLAKAPADRYPDMAAVRQELGAVRRRIAASEDTSTTMRGQKSPRNPALDRAMERARSALDSGTLDVALAAVDEALRYDAADSDAVALKQRLVTAVEAKRRAEEEVTRARAVVATARERFDAGDHGTAIGMLEVFQPAPLVARALAGLHAELQEIERRRVEAERRAREERRRIEEARRRQEEARKLDTSERERTVVQRRFDSDATVAFQPVPRQGSVVVTKPARTVAPPPPVQVEPAPARPAFASPVVIGVALAVLAVIVSLILYLR